MARNESYLLTAVRISQHNAHVSERCQLRQADAHATGAGLVTNHRVPALGHQYVVEHARPPARPQTVTALPKVQN